MSERPNPDTCTRCGESKPLAEFRRTNGSYGVWCRSCRRQMRGGRPDLLHPFTSPTELLHQKYAVLLVRLRRQRDRYGRDLPDAARLQMTLIEEIVRDLEAVLDEKADLTMRN